MSEMTAFQGVIAGAFLGFLVALALFFVLSVTQWQLVYNFALLRLFVSVGAVFGFFAGVFS